MRNRFFLLSTAVIVLTIVVLRYEAHAAHTASPEHCGFWTTIDAGLSCR